MKKLLLVLAVILVGCSPNWIRIGMSEGEFRSQRWSNLRMEEYSSTRATYGVCNDWGTVCVYYYFVGGRLDHVNSGEYVPNVRVEVK